MNVHIIALDSLVEIVRLMLKRQKEKHIKFKYSNVKNPYNNRSRFEKMQRNSPFFFFVFPFFFRHKKGRQVGRLPVEPGRRSVWARGGADWCQRCHRKSFKVHILYIFAIWDTVFLHLKRKGKMKTCMLLYVIFHICNLEALGLQFGFPAVRRLGTAASESKCRRVEHGIMASWHRVSGDRREFWKGLVEWKESRGSETSIFSFYVVFFPSLDFFTWTCRDASVSQAQSQKEDMQHSTMETKSPKSAKPTKLL